MACAAVVTASQDGTHQTDKQTFTGEMNSLAPDFTAGVIEGFYGRPWTDTERRVLFGWLRHAGLNTYMYAPKDDLKHRVAWRERYSRDEIERLAALNRACRRFHLSFCYAIAPGLDIRFSSATDQIALRNKLEQVRSIGCRDFALLFDDIPARLNPADRRRFGSAAAAQANTANALFQWMSETRERTSLFFCPTVYCGAMASPAVTKSTYLRELGAILRPEIGVFWTGPQIVSNAISLRSIREVAAVLKRRPVLWDNSHANDYDMRRLHLGPYSGRPAALRGEISGVLLNPNRQCAANFVPVHTLGSWLRARRTALPGAAYDAALRAWFRAFEAFGPRHLRRTELRLLCDFCYLPFRFGPQARQYLNDIHRLICAPPARWGGVERRFHATREAVLRMFDILVRLRDRDLLHALYPYLWDLKETVLLLEAWVRWRKKHPAAYARFCPTEFFSVAFRGGFAAAVERLLPMDNVGCLNPTAEE